MAAQTSFSTPLDPPSRAFSPLRFRFFSLAFSPHPFFSLSSLLPGGLRCSGRFPSWQMRTNIIRHSQTKAYILGDTSEESPFPSGIHDERSGAPNRVPLGLLASKAFFSSFRSTSSHRCPHSLLSRASSDSLSTSCFHIHDAIFRTLPPSLSYALLGRSDLVRCSILGFWDRAGLPKCFIVIAPLPIAINPRKKLSLGSGFFSWIQVRGKCWLSTRPNDSRWNPKFFNQHKRPFYHFLKGPFPSLFSWPLDCPRERALILSITQFLHFSRERAGGN